MNSRIVRLFCVLAISVFLLAVDGLGAKGGGTKPPKSFKARDYCPALSAGDIRVYRIRVKEVGLEVYEGEENYEWIRREVVSSPVKVYGGRMGHVLSGADRERLIYSSKGGVFRLIGYQHEDRIINYKKPFGLKKRMKFGKRYKVKNKSTLAYLIDDVTFNRKHLNYQTASLGDRFDGQSVSIDDTVRVDDIYTLWTTDNTITYEGVMEQVYARGIGPVQSRDVYLYEDRYWVIYGTIRIETTWEEELLYAKIGGVEYGDTSYR
jgi:hypothetical protein